MRPLFRFAIAVTAAILAASGCVPNRLDVSNDGRTLYFSIGPEGPFGRNDAMVVYAMDVETGAMRALTDGRDMMFWPVLDEANKQLICMGAWGGEPYVAAVPLGGGQPCPLTGILKASGYPWRVRGQGALFLMQRLESGGLAVRWLLFDSQRRTPVALDLPDGDESLKVTAGLAQDRFAVAVKPVAPLAPAGPPPAAPPPKADAPPVPAAAPAPAPEPGAEVAVYVVDLSREPSGENEGPKPLMAKAVKVASWRTQADEPAVDLAFSADGRRLLAAPAFLTEEPTARRIYELDPAGKAEPKVLFEDPGGRWPAWAPDGKTVLYLRPCAANTGWHELVSRGLEAGAEPKVLARLPGSPSDTCTTWRWLPDGRLRVYSLNTGLRIVEMKADGSEAKGKSLPFERLMALKSLADFQRANAMVPNVADEPPSDEFNNVFKAVMDPLEKARPEVAKAVEAAVKAANRWNDVPALPEVKKAPDPAAPTPPAPAPPPAAPAP